MSLARDPGQCRVSEPAPARSDIAHRHVRRPRIPGYRRSSPIAVASSFGLLIRLLCLPVGRTWASFKAAFMAWEAKLGGRLRRFLVSPRPSLVHRSAQSGPPLPEGHRGINGCAAQENKSSRMPVPFQAVVILLGNGAPHELGPFQTSNRSTM